MSGLPGLRWLYTKTQEAIHSVSNDTSTPFNSTAPSAPTETSSDKAKPLAASLGTAIVGMAAILAPSVILERIYKDEQLSKTQKVIQGVSTLVGTLVGGYAGYCLGEAWLTNDCAPGVQCGDDADQVVAELVAPGTFSAFGTLLAYSLSCKVTHGRCLKTAEEQQQAVENPEVRSPLVSRNC